MGDVLSESKAEEEKWSSNLLNVASDLKVRLLDLSLLTHFYNHHR
jgi:hypothetical protein